MSDSDDLFRLACGVAVVMPSSVAIRHAGLEWRVIHSQWLSVLGRIGLTEDEARRIGAKAMQDAIREELTLSTDGRA